MFDTFQKKNLPELSAAAEGIINLNHKISGKYMPGIFIPFNFL